MKLGGLLRPIRRECDRGTLTTRKGQKSVSGSECPLAEERETSETSSHKSDSTRSGLTLTLGPDLEHPK